MWSPLLLQCTWWLVTNKAMVDYEMNLNGWLEDATLFPAEPNDYSLNFDEILTNVKTNNEALLDADLPDLDWLDEKADLSILDDPRGFHLPPFEAAETLNLEDATSLILGLIDSNLDTSYLSSDVSKNELNDILDYTAEIAQQVTSPEISDFPPSSPYYDSISEASSPASIFYASSPASVLYSSPAERSSLEICLSPSDVSTYLSVDDDNHESISETSSPARAPSTSSKLDSGVVSVTICKMDPNSNPLCLENTVSMDEITNSVKKRKYVSDGKDIPKVHVSLKNVFHPYAKAVPKRRGERNERKKVQNKEAAARYRIKKRLEERGLSGEVAELESEQKELQKKHDALLGEIKYLKNLMREVLQKKGILK